MIAFALLDRLVGATEGLVVGPLVSAVLLVRDAMSADRTPKVLEIGTTILFGGLAVYALFGAPTWSIAGVRLRVDAGLLLIVLVSIAVRRPFTSQYARERVARGLWASPEFVRTNYVISAVWALAFFVLVGADLLLVYAPGLSPRVGILATVAALGAAVKVTGRYPERGRVQAWHS
ncbi:MAG TPA: hypothetical protein VGD56_09620 [Gemmatirosa sp.]